MKPKSVFIELLIAAAVVALYRLCVALFGNNTLDINLHDTYFVISPVNLSPLVLVIFYAIKDAFAGYRKIASNLIAIVANVWLLLELTAWMRSMVVLEETLKRLNARAGSQNGWTIYPPLSALPKAVKMPVYTPSLPFIFNVKLQTVVFGACLIWLIVLAFLTGKNWNIKQPNAKA